MKKILAMVITLVFICSSFVVYSDTNSEHDCSDWAVNSISIADAIGLISVDETYLYSAPISRETFCELIYNLILTTDYFENWYDEETKGGTQPIAPFAKRPFDDCTNNAVYDLYNHNIVEGKSITEFAPNETLTREEAATIIVRMINIVHPLPTTEMYYSYDDVDEMAEWSLPSIQIISNLGFMQGVGNNKFAPKDTYTVEEAIVTILRVYNALNHSTADQEKGMQNNAFELGYYGKEGWVGESVDFQLGEAVAIAIADDVFLQIEGTDFIDKTTVVVDETYDEKCFVVSRYKELVPGGDLSVIIRKSDGKILKVIAGE